MGDEIACGAVQWGRRFRRGSPGAVAASVGDRSRIDLQCALLCLQYVHIGRSVLPTGSPNGHRLRRFQHPPQVGSPRPGRDDQLLASVPDLLFCTTPTAAPRDLRQDRLVRGRRTGRATEDPAVALLARRRRPAPPVTADAHDTVAPEVLCIRPLTVDFILHFAWEDGTVASPVYDYT